MIIIMFALQLISSVVIQLGSNHSIIAQMKEVLIRHIRKHFNETLFEGNMLWRDTELWNEGNFTSTTTDMND